MLKGTGASPGIAIGRAVLFSSEIIQPQQESIRDLPGEISRFRAAIEKSKIDLNKIKEKTQIDLGEEQAQIFESHLMFLEDPELINQVVKKVEQEKVNVEWALQSVANQFVTTFEAMADAYMAERAADIRDVTQRLLNYLLGRQPKDISTLQDHAVIVTHDLSPSQTATMNKGMVLGFLTNIGGRTSHSAIMARTMEIPAIVGLGDATLAIKDGDLIVLDGGSGEVFVNPDDDCVQLYRRKQEGYRQKRAKLDVLKGQPSVTKDGHHVVLAGNIGTPHDVPALLRNDGEMVGLLRTEFLFMNRKTIPSEAEQFEAYSAVLRGMGAKRCLIRTLDIGGDKKLDYLDIGHELNPFLGYRAIRICLKDQEIFRIQLRALLRASTAGKLGIMFPMISSLEELLAAKKILAEVKNELTARKAPVSNDIKIGMMIEVPSAAMITDILVQHVDFISIGTNDLIQYTCAVDRMNEKIEHLYNPYNPGVLRLIHRVIVAGVEAQVEVAMCGSVSHIPDIVPFLLGCGLEEFSMSPLHILPTRKIIRSLNYEDCRALVPKVLGLGTAEEIKDCLQQFLQTAGIHLDE